MELPSPSESFVRRRSSKHIGLPAPGSVLTLAERPTLPVFPRRPHTRKRLLVHSSPGVRPSFTASSQRPRPRPLDRRHLSWGFSPLQRIGRRESTARRFPDGHPGFPGLHRRVPPRQLRCRSQAFSTSQRLLPPLAVLPFSDRWRSWGSTLQGFIPPTQPRRLVAAGMPS